ncbi:DUF4338 domain-containing protein [Pseudomonas aeruginosa]|uniref:Druantia anti-phage system protein DruA n=1 Tax=Pseudomonas aeruginosa TaxID=287 RepID=UPI0003B99AB5|nr:Druantia anti-phage system protein DruA [Pseudomonas aeruginosa]EKJ8727510.1 DUF4338 domain-containing protein [Pseudomonas aeruginosa]ERU98556.1 hypothetical protein Q080_01703 [Pseudomonas aeruginosa M8A.1]MBI8850133.1 DUF4338 domain-containing protein [Pseudomonas aeruginosa]MBX5556916.1 DUF4338 domain-containing protein [Pseudomonas aeruginosa]MCS7643121.1 DUF4338 domain-containing protein [Pseudomonas aeruginosa]
MSTAVATEEVVVSDILDSPEAGSIQFYSQEQQALLIGEIHAAWETCRKAVEAGDKDLIRALHISAKLHDQSTDFKKIQKNLHKHKSYFPLGQNIDPGKIKPRLVAVKEKSLEEDLFRITRSYWSMPYSKGYGRRLRFILIDEHHEAVIGIIGLQSPSADLACRDQYLGIEKDKKLELVNNTLDAYTIGATPAYAALLGGKLVAGFLHSEEIRKQYWRVYGNKRTTLLNRKTPQPLLAITTASAFGKSSIYNRLKYNETLLAKPLGYTKGYGTLHLESIYPKIVDFLKFSGKHVPAGFGNGPKVRWQNIIKGLAELGISRDYLAHGLKREIYIFEFVDNLIEVCRNGETPNMTRFDDNGWSEYWKEKWGVPRSLKNSHWKSVDSVSEILRAIPQREAIVS